MTARTLASPSLALLLGVAGAILYPTAPLLAADDASTAPSLPKHEMGGNDAKPGFFDLGNAPSGKDNQKAPAPGKAAGSSYPDAPPVPSAK